MQALLPPSPARDQLAASASPPIRAHQGTSPTNRSNTFHISRWKADACPDVTMGKHQRIRDDIIQNAAGAASRRFAVFPRIWVHLRFAGLEVDWV